MDRGDVLSGAAFTAVLRSAIIFLVILTMVGWATLSYVERNLVAELGQDVQEQWQIIASDHATEGADHVVAMIRNVRPLHLSGRRALALFDTDDQLVAGNLLSRPDGQGLQVGVLEHAIRAANNPTNEFVYYSGDLDGRTLVVAQRLDILHHTRILVFRTLALTGFAVVLTMLSLGYFLSRQSLLRLREIEATLQRASDGETSARIPENAGTTQIDRVARQMNRHLDRLSRLMDTTRNTAAAVAHDLKSPLGRAYLALGQALDQVEARTDPSGPLLDAQSELEQMRALFDAYLQLSRITGGADGAAFGPVDLGALIEELAETFSLIAEDAGQELVTRVEGAGQVNVSGNPQMLQQLVVNLLQNAINYGPDGNEITMELTRRDDGIQLVIADTGPGIPEAARERVFQPFQRLDPSRSKPGSGLGLALVHAIAERHGASISLEGNDPGLRVSIIFPA